MNDLHCADCTTHKNVYPIITNDSVEPLCSRCITQREAVDIIKESGRTELVAPRLDKNFPHLTVKELKERLKDVPDETPAAYQRIEDFYFEKHNWKSHELPFDYGNNTSEYIIGFSA